MVAGSPAGGDARLPATPRRRIVTGPDAEQLLAAHLRTLRIIVGALLAGAATFAGIAIFLRAQGHMPPPPGVPIVSYVALGFGAIDLIARAVVPSAVVAGMRKGWAIAPEVPLGNWLGLYVTRTIIGAALLEGATFMFLISYLLEGAPWALAAGVVFWGLLALLQFPTRDGVERWVDAQREALQQERMGV
jgi:hypothetical protein